MTARKTPMKRIALTNSSYRMGFTTSALPPNRSLSSSEEVNTTTGIIFKLSLACRAEGFAKVGVSLPQEFETVHQGPLQVQQNRTGLPGRRLCEGRRLALKRMKLTSAPQKIKRLSSIMGHHGVLGKVLPCQLAAPKALRRRACHDQLRVDRIIIHHRDPFPLAYQSPSFVSAARNRMWRRHRARPRPRSGHRVVE